MRKKKIICACLTTIITAIGLIGCGIENDVNSESNEHLSNSQHNESGTNKKAINVDKIAKKCFNKLSKENAQYGTIAQYYAKQVYGFESIVLDEFEDGLHNVVELMAKDGKDTKFCVDIVESNRTIRANYNAVLVENIIEEPIKEKYTSRLPEGSEIIFSININGRKDQIDEGIDTILSKSYEDIVSSPDVHVVGINIAIKSQEGDDFNAYNDVLLDIIDDVSNGRDKRFFNPSIVLVGCNTDNFLSKYIEKQNIKMKVELWIAMSLIENLSDTSSIQDMYKKEDIKFLQPVHRFAFANEHIFGVDELTRKIEATGLNGMLEEIKFSKF